MALFEFLAVECDELSLPESAMEIGLLDRLELSVLVVVVERFELSVVL